LKKKQSGETCTKKAFNKMNIKHSISLTALLMCLAFGLNAQNNAPANMQISSQQRSIIAIAALTAKGDLPKLSAALHTGLDSGLTVLQIKEALVHLYAYCGFPRSIRGLQTFMQVLEERKTRGIQDNIGEEASPIPEAGSKYERGKKVLGELTKMPQDRPLTGYSAFAPVIDTFLKEHLFADIFERDVLNYAERELVTISVLSTIGNAEPMLRNHFTICLNIGFTADQLNEFVEIIQPTIGEKEAENTQKVLNDLLGKNKVLKNTDGFVSSEILPEGEKIVSPNFTGTVWLNMLVSADTTFNINAGNVTFEPGARTNWHSHPGGQVLLVISGKGLYQEQGKPAIEIQQGDVIKCNPNIPHWHGAAPDSKMSHIAIGTNQDKGAVKWLEPVTEKEYRQ
jgi:4-carboxymuconolactone decarboxylase